MNKDLYNIVDHILIPHTSFSAATNKMLQCIKLAENADEPICIALIGESRSGKTRVLTHVEEKYPRQRLRDGLRIPVLRVTTPARPTIKGFAEEILTSIGDPRPEKGTEKNMSSRIVTLLQQAGTRMIMVDEFQHFYDKERHRVMHHVADWFKVLVDKCSAALVVSGLESCQAVLQQNEQLAGRFLAPIYMPRFDWKNPILREEFIGILEAFHTGLDHFDIPKLDTDEMAFRFFCATGGLMGYITKILRQAVWNALDTGTHVITLEDLSLAYHESIYQFELAADLSNVFDRGFTLSVNEELLMRVRRIGISTPEPIRARKSHKKPVAPTAGEILRT